MRFSIALFAGVAMTALSPQAAAQTTASPEDEAGQGEIVVTATRRAESIQKVPVAVQAIGGDELESRNLTTTTDIQFAAPSLTFLQGPGSTSSNFSIRGIGTVGGAPSLEESVGLVVDGVTIGARGAGITNMVDIAQVEVLRGPQGMLFGKNASAGVVTITSNAPDLGTFGGRLRASYGSHDDRRVQGVLNVPIVEDRFGIRLAGLYAKRDPFQRNLANNNKYNDLDEVFVRGRARFELSDAVTVDLSTDYSKTRTSCCQMMLVNAQASNALVQAVIATGVRPGLYNDDSAHNSGLPFSTSINSGEQVEVNYDFGPATATAVFAHRYFRNSLGSDADFSPVQNTTLYQTQKLDQLSQEFRLTSNDRLFGAVDYVLGAYFYQADASRNRTQVTSSAVRTFSPVESDSVALFGLATVHATPELRFVLGGRYSSDNVSQNDYSGPATAPLPRVTGGISSAKNFSYKAGVQYDVAPDVMLFATVTEGYKGPAFSAIPPGGPGLSPTAIAVRPELSTEYAAGIRSQFLNRKITANFTLFRQDFSNFQAVTFDPAVVASYLRNAGAARTQGLEWEISLRPVRGLTITNNGGWVDAKYTDYKGVQCSPIYRANFPSRCPGGLIDATGQPLQNAPEFTNNFAATYETPLSGDLSLTLQGSYTYRSEVNFLSTGDPYTIQPGYGLVNGSIAVAGAEDRWRLSVFARNLLDQNFSSGMIAAPNALGASTLRSVGIEAQRTIGVSIDFRF